MLLAYTLGCFAFAVVGYTCPMLLFDRAEPCRNTQVLEEAVAKMKAENSQFFKNAIDAHRIGGDEGLKRFAAQERYKLIANNRR